MQLVLEVQKAIKGCLVQEVRKVTREIQAYKAFLDLLVNQALLERMVLMGRKASMALLDLREMKDYAVLQGQQVTREPEES